MKNYLFERSLLDRRIYEECRVYTHKIAQDVFSLNGQQDRWIALPEPMFGDGTPICDGNPLVAYWHKVFGRAVRIILLDPLNQDVDALGPDVSINAYVAEDNLEPALPPVDLVIALKPNADNFLLLKRLLTSWAVNLSTPECMRRVIKDIVPG